MKIQSIILGVTILFSFALQAPVHAAANNFYAGIQLGPEFLTDNGDNNLDDALAFGVYGGYHFDRQLALEASLTTASHDGIGNSELNVTSLLIGPRLTGHINPSINVYGGVGLGIYFLDYQWGRYDHSDTKSGMYLGGGIEFPIQSNIKLGMDFKYHVIFDNNSVDSDLMTLLMRVGF
jgi:opacity protein-like surface antigen